MTATDPLQSFILLKKSPVLANALRKILLVIVALILSPQVLACSCEVGTIDESFTAANTTFRLLVTGTELRPTSELIESELFAEEELSEEEIAEILEDMPNYVRVSFKLIETYKGETGVPDYLYELTFSPGNCGLGLITGVEYVIFSEGNPIEFATYCTGSFGFFNAEGTEIKPDLDRLRELAQ